jgi:hypothetical protein
MQSLGFNISGLGNVLRAKTWHLQRTFSWKLLMHSNFNGVLGYLVSQYCQDISFGDYRISELSTVQHGAFQRFYAGLQSIESIDLVFLVPSDNSVMDYFYGWYDRMIDSDGYYSAKHNYRRDVYLLMYDQSGEESTRFRLIGTFPTGHPKIHPTYEQDDVLHMSITLSVDSIEPSSIGVLQKGVRNLLVPVLSKIF